MRPARHECSDHAGNRTRLAAPKPWRLEWGSSPGQKKHAREKANLSLSRSSGTVARTRHCWLPPSIRPLTLGFGLSEKLAAQPTSRPGRHEADLHQAGLEVSRALIRIALRAE